jgi:hypothetical protein
MDEVKRERVEKEGRVREGRGSEKIKCHKMFGDRKGRKF